MKNLTLLFISLSLTLILSSCSAHTPPEQEPTPEPVISASVIDLLPISDVQEIISYTLVTKNVTENSLIYTSDPIGAGDTISVSINQYSSTVTKEQIRSEYEEQRSRRPSAEAVEGIGESAYIAYPSIHIYQNGYCITVTAGSGSDQYQHDLLVLLGKIVINNLNEIVNV